MGNACYYSFEKILSSYLLFKKLEVNDYTTGETWCLTLRQEHRLRVFENKVLKKVSGAKRKEITKE